MPPSSGKKTRPPPYHSEAGSSYPQPGGLLRGYKLYEKTGDDFEAVIKTKIITSNR